MTENQQPPRAPFDTEDAETRYRSMNDQELENYARGNFEPSIGFIKLDGKKHYGYTREEWEAAKQELNRRKNSTNA